MGAFLLPALGAAVIVATVAAARRTRPPAPRDRLAKAAVPVAAAAYPVPLDPWAAATEPLPRALWDEAQTRRRMWPAAGVLAGVALILGGVVAAQTGSGRPSRTPRPFVIEVGSPSPVAEEAGFPSPAVTPAPPALSAPTAPTPLRASHPSTPKPTAGPATPKPVPGAGPSVGASTSCFGTTSSPAASVSYSAQASPGTRLASLTVSFDGRTIQRPSVSGRTSYSGQAPTQSTTAGHHQFTVTATDTSGAATTRTLGVTCG